MDVPAFSAERATLIEGGLQGAAFCAAYAELTDRLLHHLFAAAREQADGRPFALVAVGGYGRAELCPASDIDVLLVHRGGGDITGVAERIWYPLWDAGLKVGHGVRTVKEALSLAGGDLETATSLLDARHVAGDTALATELRALAVAQWQRRAGRWLDQLRRAVDERHAKAGEVAFLLEPDLKEGRGGLRDVHALRWAEAARRVMPPRDRRQLAQSYATLLAARVELHRRTSKASDRLLLQEQDGVADALGEADADALMRRIAGAARTIAWVSDQAWQDVSSWRRGPKSPRRTSRAAGVVTARHGVVEIDPAGDTADPALALRAATLAAEHGTPLGRATLEAFRAGVRPPPEPWPDPMRNDFVALLATGRAAIGTLEALDQTGVLTTLIPEWAAVQARPQRNAYHRFTVDRHLSEAAAEAASRTADVARPDLLLIGALLHDIGKGFVDPADPLQRDHSIAGERVVTTIAARMGFSAADVGALRALTRHHLLLADVATRRDLDDPATVALVVEHLPDPDLVKLLAVLTEADSVATGPAAWGTWKAGLVRQLVARVLQHLGGEEPPPAAVDPTPEQRKALDEARTLGEPAVHADGVLLTVVSQDRPGVFSRVAGTLTLHGLDVLDARAFTTEDGWAVESFTVSAPDAATPRWDAVGDDVRRVLAGRLSIEARLAERARAYAFRRRPVPPITPRVTVHDDASDRATVVEVRAPDRMGTLYRVTRALADLDMDIRSAKITTIGHEVVDAFYVLDANGNKLDLQHAREVEHAVLAELARL